MKFSNLHQGTMSKHLYIIKLSDTELCSLCIQEEEAVIHLSANCLKSKTLWKSFFFPVVYLILALNSPVEIYRLIHPNEKIHINKAKHTIKCFLHIFT